VLCSFILSSPLFCFLTSIKSRPFSNYQVTVFIKIWIVNFKILNMKWRVLMWLRYNFSKEKSLSHQSPIASPPVHRSTSSPVYQFTSLLFYHSRLTTHVSPLTTKPLHYYTTHDTCHFEPACVPWKAGDFR
jgi:hypothetical protein